MLLVESRTLLKCHIYIGDFLSFVSLTASLSRMWPSLKMLFWSLFGLIELSSFEAERGVETAVGTGLLALWLVLAVIVLLNMLIALISDAFQKVQVY